MSRRVRAGAFAAAALLCAALAAGLASGYRDDVAAEYGALRPVVVALEPLAPGRPLRPKAAERALEVRRVPERFVPPDAVSAIAEAVGQEPAVAVPAGSYVVSSQLAVPKPSRASRRRAGPGRSPIDIAVAAAGGLARLAPRGPRRVDVVVTMESGPGGGSGRTFVAAEGVRLLELHASADEPGLSPGPDPAGWVATLALTRAQALRLIQAESFARQVRLIAR